MRGVCSSFQWVAGAEEPHRWKEFSPSSSEQNVVFGIHDSGHDSCSGLFSLPEQCAAARQGQRLKSATYLWTERRRRKKKELLTKCAMNRQATPGVFSTRIYLAHSSDLAGSSQGCEQTFVPHFPQWVNTLKDLFAFQIWIHSHTQSEIIKLLNCRRAQREPVGKSLAFEQDCQPASHGTQHLPGISTQPITSSLSFCLLYAVIQYTLFSLCYKSLVLGHQSKHLCSVLVQVWVRCVARTVLSTDSTAPQTSCTLAEDLSVTYSIQINAKCKLDLLYPLQKGQSEAWDRWVAAAPRETQSFNTVLQQAGVGNNAEGGFAFEKAGGVVQTMMCSGLVHADVNYEPLSWD